MFSQRYRKQIFFFFLRRIRCINNKLIVFGQTNVIGVDCFFPSSLKLSIIPSNFKGENCNYPFVLKPFFFFENLLFLNLKM